MRTLECYVPSQVRLARVEPGDVMFRESRVGGLGEEADEFAGDKANSRVSQVGTIPACAVLSPAARLVLGCLEILDAPSVGGLVEITGLGVAEVRRCIAELHAIGEATIAPPRV
jgi:hypothetical protein